MIERLKELEKRTRAVHALKHPIRVAGCPECDWLKAAPLLLAVAEAAEKEHGAAFYHTDKENCAVCAALAAMKGAKP